jgi:hypothetical protein
MVRVTGTSPALCRHPADHLPILDSDAAWRQSSEYVGDCPRLDHNEVGGGTHGNDAAAERIAT